MAFPSRSLGTRLKNLAPNLNQPQVAQVSSPVQESGALCAPYTFSHSGTGVPPVGAQPESLALPCLEKIRWAVPTLHFPFPERGGPTFVPGSYSRGTFIRDTTFISNRTLP